MWNPHVSDIKHHYISCLYTIIRDWFNLYILFYLFRYVFSVTKKWRYTFSTLSHPDLSDWHWYCYCSCEGREANWSISFSTTTESEWQGKYSTDLVSLLIRWQAVRFGQSSTLHNCSFKAHSLKWRFQLSP